MNMQMKFEKEIDLLGINDSVGSFVKQVNAEIQRGYQEFAISSKILLKDGLNEIEQMHYDFIKELQNHLERRYPNKEIKIEDLHYKIINREISVK